MSGYNLREIHAKSPAVYSVVLERERERVSFDMRVEPGDIEIVTWSDDFDQFMHNRAGGAGPLFDAVLRFHRAQRRTYPA